MQKIGIGYEDYKRFTDDNLYYVDKTLLIRDILESGAIVTLFTRPRRFGKTLALSMLRTFFEAEMDREGNPADNRRYFEGKKVMDCGEEVLSQMGQYPVIKLSLKSAKQPSFYSAFMKLREEIISEFRRHEYLEGSTRVNEEILSEFSSLEKGYTGWEEKARSFQNAEDEKRAFDIEVNRYATALKTLSECLYQHHGKKVIILLDEYDAPLENAYYSGFYDQMVGFVRSLFESALKTNDALDFAVITGCLRISRESIFTGLNHLEVNSIRDNGYAEGFGFTIPETLKMLEDYGLSERKEEVLEWYDGYLFGETEICNPWSIIKYVNGIRMNGRKFAEPYWANTSSNQIIRDLVEHATEEQKEELDTLISGGTIEKQIHEDITYDEIYRSEDNLWNFLFFTGYMREVSERKEGDDIFAEMRIPNREIRAIYREHIRNWFNNIVKKTPRNELHRAVLEKDTDEAGRFLTELLMQSISTFDSTESFYHGFLLSLLIGLKNYSAKSNREEGEGRPDIVLYPKLPTDPAYIFEVKIRRKFNEMQDGVEEALRQIREKRYEDGILEEGYAGVISYGVCFCKKACILGLME